MTITTSTLRPGLLVSVKTRLSGNVSYRKTTIDPEQQTDAGALRYVWETERVISDPVEHAAAVTTRSSALTAIRRVCSRTEFGLLCPEADKDVLDAAISEARKLAAEFNGGSRLTKISINVIAGRIAPDDVEAVRAINGEVRDLMDAMAEGVRNLDVKVIRDAAARAKSIGQMLTPEMQARVQIAVESARKAAKEIVAAGEQAAIEVDQSTIRKITDMRTAFIDLDEAAPVAAPEAEARALDLAPEVYAPNLAALAAMEAPSLDDSEAYRADAMTGPNSDVTPEIDW